MKRPKSAMHRYQSEIGVQHIINNRFCALFLDMGLGKTVTTLTALRTLILEELEVRRVLLVAPKRVVESVWTAEQEAWEHLGGLKLVRVVGTDTERREALKTPGDIYLVSRDNLVWLCSLFGGMRLPFDMLVIDESSSFKNPDSKRFKALARTSLAFNRIVCLTGTPAPNSLMDLWPQLYLLDRGQRLGKSITAFRKSFFAKRSFTFGYDIKEGSDVKIYNAISDICISMRAEDYLTLPERMDVYVKLNFTPAQRFAYDTFAKKLVLDLESSGELAKITVANATGLLTKLLQYANGALYDEENKVHHVHDAKIDALAEIMEEACGQPVLVARNFKHDRDRIMQKLAKYSPRELKSDADVKDWNDGKIQLLLMHPASGGHGLNLQAGGHIIVWFGPTFSSELYKQFNARLCRQGQTKPTIVHHLLMAGTVDYKALSALHSKGTNEENLMIATKAILSKYLKNH